MKVVTPSQTRIRAALDTIVCQHGLSITNDFPRLHSLLNDACPRERREAAVLVGALREPLIAELRRQHAHVPFEILKSRLARDFYDAVGVDEELASWAIDVWAGILGLSGATSGGSVQEPTATITSVLTSSVPTIQSPSHSTAPPEPPHDQASVPTALPHTQKIKQIPSDERTWWDAIKPALLRTNLFRRQIAIGSGIVVGMILLLAGLNVVLVSDAEAYQSGVIASRRCQYEQALKIFGRLAERGEAKAQCWLGVMHQLGRGTPQDPLEARRAFRRALPGLEFLAYPKGGGPGDADARWLLGQMSLNGWELQGNYPLAMSHFQQAFPEFAARAAQGDWEASYMLGACYRNGWGVDRDDLTAFDWSLKAAKQGHADAQCDVAECYWNGRGVTRNVQTGIDWYLNAANQGHVEAQYCLGRYYRDEDTTKSRFWLNKAAAQGHPGAANDLQWLK